MDAAPAPLAVDSTLHLTPPPPVAREGGSFNISNRLAINVRHPIIYSVDKPGDGVSQDLSSAN
ncbi:hypothetical protein J6590_012914 [Homalodisca vitripennis]|nr:hypothetical protein J6590_012914 [Homalodisca vitripennis]